MKKIFHVVLLIVLLMFVNGMMISAEENQVNMEYPEFTGEFHEYGFSITCEDQNFLNSIDQIKMTSVDLSGEYSFTNDQWIIRDHELFLPCEVYWSEGLTRTIQSIEIIVDGNTVPAFLSSPVNTVPSDVVITIENKLDLVISSTDDYWISLMMSQGDQRAISLWGENQMISSNELVYRDGKIILSEQVLKNHQLKEGKKYSLHAESFTNYQSIVLTEITYTTIRDGETYDDLVFVSDVEATFTDVGLKVGSSDLNYIQGIDQLIIELDDARVVLNEGWTIGDGELFLPCHVLFEKGLSVGKHYNIIISSKGYFDERRQDYLDKQLAADVVLSINHNNDIVISSSDDYWLKELLKFEDDKVLNVMSDPHHVIGTITGNDLIYQDHQVLIPYEVQKECMSQGISYLLHVGGYIQNYQYQTLGEIRITYDFGNVLYENLVLPPAFDVSYTDYGMILTSDDENYLQSIQAIQMFGNSFETEKVSGEWDVVGNQLYIPCTDFLSKGAVNGRNGLLVFALGYHCSRSVIQVPRFLGKDASVFVDEQGNVVITGSDSYWLKILVEKNSTLSFLINSISYAGIPLESAEIQNDKIVVSPEVQIEYDLMKGQEYMLSVSPKHLGYRSQDLNEVVLTHARKQLPTDAKAIKNDKGQLEITSSNQDWIQEILANPEKTGNSCMTMRMGYGTIYHFYEEDFIIKDGKLILEQAQMISKGITSGYYQCVIDSASYKKLEMTFYVDQPVIPDDVMIQVDQSTGDLKIYSQDKNWLKSLTELHDEYAAVYVSAETYETYFFNDEQNTDLVFDTDHVVISSEAQRRRGLIQDEHVIFEFYSTGYGLSQEYEVTIGKGGLKALPTDLMIRQDESGNVLIETEDVEYLEELAEGIIEFRVENQEIWWEVTGGYEMNSTGLILSHDVLMSNGFGNGVYTIGLITSTYPVYNQQCTLTQLKSDIDFEIQVRFDENEGIVIESENKEYIASITNVDITYDQELGNYTYDDSQTRKEENRYVILMDEMIKDGVISKEYQVFIYSDKYRGTVFTVVIESEYLKKNEIVRIKGTTRYQTSLEIADALKERMNVERFETVILVNGRDFADALAGSVLAIQRNAPILMVDSKNNNMSEIIAYLFDNMDKNGKVILLGGEAAVPEFVEESLQANGYSYERIKGKNRFETNIEILKEAEFDSDVILVSNGKSFADSLSASATGYPILLVGNTLNDVQKQFLSEHAGKHFVILGGTGAVNDEVEQMLKEFGTTERVYGKTRYETSIEIAKRFFPDADEMILAYAKNYPDGLCGGPLAYVMNAPLILTVTGNSAAKDYNHTVWIVRGAVLGGEVLISDDAVAEIFYKYPVIKQ